MFVADLHTLQTVHSLDFVNNVASQSFDTLKSQDVMRIGRTVNNDFALVNHLTVVNQNVLILRNKEFMILTLGVSNDQTLFALGFLTEGNGTACLGKNTCVLRRAGFEELGNTRQTAGNVSSLLAFRRNSGKHVTDLGFVTVMNDDESADRQLNAHRMLGARNLNGLVVGIEELNQRLADLAGRRVLSVDNDQRAQAGNFVHLALNRDVVDNVGKANFTCVFGNDRTSHRIPVGKFGSDFNLLTIGCKEVGAVRNLMTFSLAAVRTFDHDFAGAGNHNLVALLTGHIAHRACEANRAGRLRNDVAGNSCTASSTTDVERTHGQLSTRFTNGLGGDNTDSLTGVNQVAAVALGAKTVACFAGKRSTDLDFVNAELRDEFDVVFFEQMTGRKDFFLGIRVDNRISRHAAQNTVSQTFGHFTAFNQGFHQNALMGSAVVFCNNQVLSHVNQTTCQITGVSRLQSRISQTLTSTVGRHEVLQNVQTFTEVRGNRSLNNGAVRLSHQTTHTGQLTDLSCRTTGTGVRHHVDGVEGFLSCLVAVTVDNRFVGDFIHHHLTDFFCRTAPNINHLVIAFAGSHQTGSVLSIDLFDFLFGFVNDLVLLFWNDHVVDSNRQTADGSEVVAALHQFVGEDHGFTQTATAESHVNQLGDLFLLEGLVQNGERQARRKNFGKKRTADGGFVTNQLRCLFTGFLVDVKFFNANGAACLELDNLVGQSAFNFADIGKEHAFALSVDTGTSRIVQAQHDVLRRNDRRIAVGREQHVVGSQHQRTGFKLCL